MGESTWIGPWGLEIGVIVIWEMIGTGGVEIERRCSLLQGAVSSLQ